MANVRDHIKPLTLLFLLTFAVLLPGITGVAFHYGDEALYMEWSRHLSFPDNFWIRNYNGDLHFHKPPVLNWFIALSFKLFGENLFAARLPSILAACMLVQITYLFGLYITGEKTTAWYSALALSSSYLFYKQSHFALTDSVMCLGIFLGSAAFLVGVDASERGKSPLPWFFISSLGIGLSGGVKGHVGTLLGALPIASFLAVYRWQGKRLPTRALVSPLFWAPALFMCGWWYVYVITNHQLVVSLAPAHLPTNETVSEAFLKYFTTKEAEGRISGGIGRIPINLFYYSIGYLRAFLPWSLLALLGLFKWNRPVREFFAGRSNAALMIIMQIVPLTVLFTFVILQQNRLRYVLPAGPAIAVLAGITLTRIEAIGGFRSKWLRPLPMTIILLIFYICSFALIKELIIVDPLQRICKELKWSTNPADSVWLLDNEPDKAVFATLMLGHEVKRVYPEDLSKIENLNPEDNILIAKSDLWRSVGERLTEQFEITSEQSQPEFPGRGKDYRAMLRGDLSEERYLVLKPSAK